MFKSDIWWAVLDLLNSLAYMELLNKNKNMADRFLHLQDDLPSEGK